jgi:hypothetical protein
MASVSRGCGAAAKLGFALLVVGQPVAEPRFSTNGPGAPDQV